MFSENPCLRQVLPNIFTVFVIFFFPFTTGITSKWESNSISFLRTVSYTEFNYKTSLWVEYLNPI